MNSSDDDIFFFEGPKYFVASKSIQDRHSMTIFQHLYFGKIVEKMCYRLWFDLVWFTAHSSHPCSFTLGSWFDSRPGSFLCFQFSVFSLCFQFMFSASLYICTRLFPRRWGSGGEDGANLNSSPHIGFFRGLF
jgi:hypothetical protein